MTDKLQISKEICALDMKNGITYIGQYVGRFNVGLINYCQAPTLELINLSKERNQNYSETLAEYYLSAKKKQFRKQ